MGKYFESVPPVEESAFIRELKELCARYGLNRPQVLVGFSSIAVDVPLPDEVTQRLIAEAKLNGTMFSAGVASGCRCGIDGSGACELHANHWSVAGGPTVTALGPPCAECGDIDDHLEGCSLAQRCGTCNSVIAYDPFTGTTCDCSSGKNGPVRCVICNVSLPPFNNGLCEAHQYDEPDITTQEQAERIAKIQNPTFQPKGFEPMDGSVWINAHGRFEPREAKLKPGFDGTDLMHYDVKLLPGEALVQDASGNCRITSLSTVNPTKDWIIRVER